jgi:integrase
MSPKLPRLPHVKYVRAKGKVYAYFNTGKVNAKGMPIYRPLPHPSDIGFFDSYTAMKGARTKALQVEVTVEDLIRKYRQEEMPKLAQGTRDTYSFSLDKISGLFGEFPVRDVTGQRVREVLAVAKWGASTRNLFLAVLSNLYRMARRDGLTDLEPTKDIDHAKTDEHQPWPEAVLNAALVAEDSRVRLAVHLLYYTGQRIGDVCRMRWSDITNGFLSVTQQKTGKSLEIPLHRDLQAELAATPRKGLTILTRIDGRPLSTVTLRLNLQDFTAGLGIKTVPHGLRKNAVNALLEHGATVPEVAAITGQTYDIVERYAARVNRRKLGEAAILKFEQRR